MGKKIAPTRGNLLRVHRALLLARKGHDLLEQKRQVLMMELVRHIDRARDLQRDMAEIFRTAYEALQRANIAVGIDTVEEIARAVPESNQFIVRLRSVMGVDIPEVDPIPEACPPCYSLQGTSGAVDRAFLAFHRVLELVARLAEVETSVYRLAVQIRKTHRRVNALEKVVIPQYGNAVAAIGAVLEEGDREDFARMKIAKESGSRRAASRDIEVGAVS